MLLALPPRAREVAWRCREVRRNRLSRRYRTSDDRCIRGISGDGVIGVFPDVVISLRTALAVISMLALTVLMLEILLHSERVIAWVLVAGVLAVLLYPLVEFGFALAAAGWSCSCW